MRLRAILFDHDGTLVDSEPIHYRLWTEVLNRYGVALTEEVFNTECAGMPTLTNATDLIKRYNLNLSAQQLAEEKHAVTNEFLADNAYPLMRGVNEAVHALLEAGLTLAIVTGANHHSVHATVRSYPFGKHFSFVISADDVEASKPAPDCYLLALDRLGLKAEECLAIEDTEHGLKAATQAGIPCLALPTSLSANHNFESATAVLEGMLEAVEYIRRQLTSTF
ncbi:HAD family phosphatase [Zwartia sp.]|uniref:HAD family hydrolase n=1 Tax=Zwartia sp. TaxID=2978004 RepID=UPI002719BD01|nr:HAD family phosphatase [Zwartia sp.]MDO9025646.1 HAD family phosphatase [Zwartia sp.]